MVNYPSAVGESGIGVLLEDCGDYSIIIPRDYQSENELRYLKIENGKTEFKRGELIFKLASLNPNVVEPLNRYLTTAIEFHTHFLLDSSDEPIEDKIAYIDDRLDDAYHGFICGIPLLNPYDTYEDFSLNEVYFLINLLMAELYRIYHIIDPTQIKDAQKMLPRLLWDASYKAALKQFLCNPSDCPSEQINQFLFAQVRTTSALIDGNIVKLVALTSIDELVAFEVEKIIDRPSDYRKPVRCEICDRLFYKHKGQRNNICSYKSKDGIKCEDKANDEFEIYWRKIYNNLKSYLGDNYHEKNYYTDFRNKVAELKSKYKPTNDIASFKAELDEFYRRIRQESKIIRDS